MKTLDAFFFWIDRYIVTSLFYPLTKIKSIGFLLVLVLLTIFWIERSDVESVRNVRAIIGILVSFGIVAILVLADNWWRIRKRKERKQW